MSKTAEYAIRAVLMLARLDPGGRATGDTIAQAIGAPKNYLSKTLYALTRAGIVTSTRGPQGGFALGTAPDTIVLADIVDAFDERRPHGQCLLGSGPCNPAAPCAAHRRWMTIGAASRVLLTTTTVAELLHGQAYSDTPI